LARADSWDPWATREPEASLADLAREASQGLVDPQESREALELTEKMAPGDRLARTASQDLQDHRATGASPERREQPELRVTKEHPAARETQASTARQETRERAV